MEDNDWKLMRSGNRSALSTLYRAHYQHLFSIGLHLFGDREIALDCINDLFLDLWNKREKLPYVENPEAYLTTCYKRELIHKKEKDLKFSSQLISETTMPLEFSYEDLLISSQSSEELRIQLKRAIQTLTPRQLDILRLKYFDRKSYDEIALIHQSAPKTIYNQVCIAIKHLRLAMKKV